jgi:hypothetical protein
MDSHLVRQERCPECARHGADTSGDNLAVYSDGHTHCYSCGYWTPADSRVKLHNWSSKSGRVDEVKSSLSLPDDCNVDYPKIALDWIEKYELTKTDLLLNNVLWSPSASRLIFPVLGVSEVIAWQGRWFGDGDYPKWYGKGNLKDTFNILGRSSSKLVLTEDIVSAIKVSKFCLAMPLYGSFVGIVRFKRLYSLYGKTLEVCVWLDPDKRTESFVEARRGNAYGLRVKTIFSEKDPKEHTYEEIAGILQESRIR